MPPETPQRADVPIWRFPFIGPADKPADEATAASPAPSGETREAQRPPRLAVVGLGNPGNRYAATRHNIGFHVIDKLAGILHIRELSFQENRWQAAGRHGAWEVILCKPWTYMNLSGEAVLSLMRQHELRPAELLVIYDEVQLPLGHLRLRGRGSDGGHNGLASVIAETGTDGIARLRCGVDFSPDAGDLAEYVLSPFNEEELPHVEAMVARAAEAVLAVMDMGMARAMNVFNTPPTTHQDSL